MNERRLRRRSQRIATGEGARESTVSFSSILKPNPEKKDQFPAQVLDVSATGARFMSRLPVKAKVGDIVNVDFQIAGSDYRIKSPARIVRKQNDMVIAVRFIGMKGFRRDVLQRAMNELVLFKKRAKLLSQKKFLLSQINKHRKKLIAALVLAALAISALVVFS